MDAYRIADSRYPIFDPTGAAMYGGRWNSAGKRVIYASESYAATMLEVLAHRNGPVVPKHHMAVHIYIPDSVMVETVAPGNLPGWDDADERISREFGDAWYDSGRTAVLRVPSVVTHGPEFNLVFDAAHPDFQHVRADDAAPIRWDPRFSR